jgi:hypothetical protein
MKAFSSRKKRGTKQHRNITSVLPVAGQNLQRHFEVYFTFFLVFKAFNYLVQDFSWKHDVPWRCGWQTVLYIDLFRCYLYSVLRKISQHTIAYFWKYLKHKRNWSWQWVVGLVGTTYWPTKESRDLLVTEVFKRGHEILYFTFKAAGKIFCKYASILFHHSWLCDCLSHITNRGELNKLKTKKIPTAEF